VKLVNDYGENSGHKAAVRDFQVDECLSQAVRFAASDLLSAAYVHKNMGALAEGHGSSHSIKLVHGGSFTSARPSTQRSHKMLDCICERTKKLESKGLA
jgi:hypothetical protein